MEQIDRYKEKGCVPFDVAIGAIRIKERDIKAKAIDCLTQVIRNWEYDEVASVIIKDFKELMNKE